VSDRRVQEPHAPSADCAGCRELFGLDVADEASTLRGGWRAAFADWAEDMAQVWHGIRGMASERRLQGRRGGRRPPD
jgi:hypothetical protein